jgi:hypothetical protein
MASPAAYANLAILPPPRPIRQSSAELKRAAIAEHERELRFKRKVDQTNRVLDRHEARIEKFSLQIAALQKRKTFQQARAARIEDRALTEMETLGAKKLAGIRHELEARPSGNPAVVVDNESLIPAKYMRQPPTPPKAPDKVAIKAVLARGYAPDATEQEIAEAQIIQGVHLAQTVSLLRK